MDLFRQAMVLVLLGALAGCGEKEEPEKEEESVSKGPRENALVSLRVKRIERPERRLTSQNEGTVLVQQAPLTEVTWESERLSEQALATLKKLVRGEDAGGAFTGEFSGVAPVPQNLGKVETTTSGWEIWEVKGEDEFLNAQDFVQSLKNELLRDAHLKIVGVEVDGANVETEVFVEYEGDGRQATATWSCRWLLGDNDSLKLARLELADYRELRGKSDAMYLDATATVLGQTFNYNSQVRRGIASWAGEISTFSDFAMTGHHGIAVGDVDGDGREDVFVCDAGGLPNRLYRQLPDGSVEDISAAAGLDWYEDSRSALFVDLDNDGDQDLVVATIGMVTFAENDGTGKFTLRGGFPGAQYPFSMCAADYDLDGDLDVYVCLYGKGDNASGARGFEAQSPVPFEDARNGGRNVLLENLGDFGFDDVTEEVGLEKNNDRWSFAAAWEDYDRDGDSDLYVANDFGKNTLYRNDGGRFSEVAAELGVEDLAAGMSVSWGDYNRDGRFDLYVGNMFSSAGGRIATQENFAVGRGEQAVVGLRRMARGNSLFSGGEESFLEVPDSAGAAMGRWSWSSGFVDVDNDGWEDLVVSNGYLTGWETKEDL